MINCKQNTFFLKLTKFMNKTSKSVKITDPIKLKKQIKLTGTLGIIIGLAIFIFNSYYFGKNT